MDCPRCKLTMEKDAYEGLKVTTCKTCAGYWLDSKQLSTVVGTRGYQWSNDEVKNLLYAIALATEQGEKIKDDDVVCPQCGVPMAKINFQGTSGIKLDRCPAEHGVWLDTGEIKRVQIYAESQSTRVRKKK